MNQFSVGSPSEKYLLTIGGYTGGGGYFTKGNEPSVNTEFTTYDNHNDAWITGSCADSAVYWGCGWWYRGCFNVNPNHQPPFSDYPTTAIFMEMKTRPK